MLWQPRAASGGTLLLLALSLTSADAGAQTTATFSYDSEPGDYIGQGASATFTEADGLFLFTQNFDNGVGMSFDGPERWNVDFAAPNEVELSPGFYPDAERFPFQGFGQPGLSMRGEGRGCNTLTGEFTVDEVVFDYHERPVRFSASFEQHCEGGVPALFGAIDFSQGTIGPVSLTPGNLLATLDDRIFEISRTGELIQELPILGGPGPASSAERVRDLIVDDRGVLHVFNGTFDPIISSLDTCSGDWRHETAADWDIVNNVSYGGIAAFGDYVFVTDMLNGARGVIRFDTANGYLVDRFQDHIEYIDVTMGLDGLLYALHTDERTVDVFPPESGILAGQVTLAQSVRGIAVNAAGTIFGASWGDAIYRFSSDGTEEANRPTFASDLTDIDVEPDGALVVGGRFGEVLLTTEALGAVTTLDLPTLVGASGTSFVAFVPTPERSIFRDSFESGDTKEWSAAYGDLLSSFMDVEPTAALSGDYGLEIEADAECNDADFIIIDQGTLFEALTACQSITASGATVVPPGASFLAGEEITLGEGFSVAQNALFSAVVDHSLLDGNVYVEDETPDGESTYEASFQLDLDALTLMEPTQIELLTGHDTGDAAQFRLILKHNDSLDENRLVLAARLNDGSFAETPWGQELLLPDGPSRIRVVWEAAAGDGLLLVSIDGSPLLGLANLTNDLGRIDRVRWGVVERIAGTGSGTLALDGFCSWR